MAATGEQLPSFPKLPRMESCAGAVAVVAQRVERRTVAVPRGFESVHARSTHKSTVTEAPAPRSALWFQELHAAYRSANFVHYSSTVTDAITIISAESMELLHAATRTEPTDAPGGDHSLPPRALGLWVLAHEEVAGASTSAHLLLDAAAHWARSRSDPKQLPLSTRMRISVATGTLKDELLQRATSQEGLDRSAVDVGVKKRLSESKAAWAVMLRWADNTGALHSAIYSWRSTPPSATLCLDQMQRAVCSLLGQYGLHLCTAATLGVPGPVPPNEWTRQSAAVDAEFVSRLSTKPSVTLSAAAGAEGAAPLEFTGVFVRVCQRRLGDDGVTHPSAFHGVLLSFGSAKREAAAFANQADPALACPLGLDEESMGLHLCAVQAQEQPLLRTVSLYSHVGRAGEPIHAPLSHVFCESAAIRPVDQALLGTWDVRPCDKSSLAPSTVSLQEPFKQHFARASELYLSLSSSSSPETPNLRSGSSGEELDAMIDRLPCAPITNDPHAERDELVIRLAFHVDMRSRRTTIGDAYGYLFDSGAPKSICDTMLNAMGQIGVRASLDDMFKLTARAVKATGQLSTDVVRENERLKRLADVCLEAIASENGEPRVHSLARPDPQALGAAEHVRRMLGSIGLKRGKEAALVPCMNDASVTVAANAIYDALSYYAPGSPLAAEAQNLVCDAFKECHLPVPEDDPDRLRRWMQITDRAAARAAAIVVLRNGLRNTPVFLITSCSGTGTVTVQQAAVEPLLVPSSFDAIVAAPRACVLLLQHPNRHGLKCKLTATVPVNAVSKNATA